MKKKIFVFDFDGTISDTTQFERTTMVDTINRFGNREITCDNIEDHYGPTEIGIIKNLLPEEKWEEAIAYFLKQYEDLQPRYMKAVDGMIDLIRELKEKEDLHLILVTGRSEETMRMSLDFLGLTSAFEKTYSGSEKGVVKGEKVEEILEKYPEIKREEILYIGDTTSDCEVFNNIDVDLISVGYCHDKRYREELERMNPGRVVDSISELKEKLNEFLIDEEKMNDEYLETSMKSEEDEGEINSEAISPETLHNLLITNNDKALLELFRENSAVTITDALKELETDEIVLFFSSIREDYDKLGNIFAYLYTEARVVLCETLPKKALEPILANVSNDDMADFLNDVKKSLRPRILSYLPKKRVTLIEGLAKFSDDTCGSIMTTEYLSVLSGTTIEDIFAKIKQIGNRLETVRTIFIVDNTNKLLGTMRLEDMMFENPLDRIDNVMTRDFAYISPIADKEQAVPICEEYDIPVLPVVSKTGEMLGIITFDDVMDVLEEENTEDFLKQAAVSPTQKPYMENKVLSIAKSYVIWLIILLVINTLTGIIVSEFESALVVLPILISFVPALNDTCGNSGSQTTSMVIRALTVEKIEKKDYLKIISREALVGLITGLFIAVLNFGWVMLELNTPILNVTEEMKQTLLDDLNLSNIQIGYAIISGITSIALLFCILFSKFFASILPIVAKALKLDPAVMSGPLVTALMDIFTLLLYFTIAIATLNALAPGLLG